MSARIINFVASLLVTKDYKHCGEWAYDNRVLPPENAEPGKFKIERTPYFIPVAQALADSRYSVVAVQCGSQMAKSELCFNFIGHRIDTRAQPSIFVFPTQKLAENVSQTRFNKLLKSSKSLSLKHQKGNADKIGLKIIGVFSTLNLLSNFSPFNLFTTPASAFPSSILRNTFT